MKIHLPLASNPELRYQIRPNEVARIVFAYIGTTTANSGYYSSPRLGTTSEVVSALINPYCGVARVPAAEEILAHFCFGRRNGITRKDPLNTRAFTYSQTLEY